MGLNKKAVALGLIAVVVFITIYFNCSR